MNIKDLQKQFKKGNFTNIIIVCLILGAVLIFISSMGVFSENTSSDKVYSVSDYKEEMQTAIHDILWQIEGVGNVSVLLTIENSVEGVYLENNSTKTKEIEPVIRGVVVACDGGDDAVVCSRVLNAVTKALNISGAKVCITKLK